MTYGTVKWFDGRKGFGFIAKEDGSGDVFAHFNEIASGGYLNEGERVKFEIAISPKGEKATNIEIA